jgi:chromosome segregation ATPase
VKYKAETEQLERIEPVYSTIKKLRALIKEKDLPGFKGLLIDFLEFDSKISSVIDLAAKSKLFSIVVEDLEAAKQVLTLNKQIKGGVVNIYPLALID